MQPKQPLLLSSIVLTLFFCAFIFVSCGGVKPVSTTVTMSSFEFEYRPPADKRQFVLLKDSTVLYGSKVTGWGTGVVNKKAVHIDGKEIPASEVIAFKSKEGYFVKIDNYTLAKRYVEGRINVYVARSANEMTWVLLQKQNGALQGVSSIDVLKNMLEDCPKAYEMINHPPKTGPRIVRPSYRQIVIETYNNCGEWKW